MTKPIHYIWTIFIIALVISCLANINLITQIYTLAQAEALAMVNVEEYHFILRIAFKNIVSELIMLLLIIFFNYSWKDILIPQNIPPKSRMALIIISNFVLLGVLIYLDFNLEKYLSPADLGKKGYRLGNYFLKHLSVLILAFTIPFLLLRMKAMKLAEISLHRLKEEKSKAELAALKEQISPHFFFNALSTLSAIVRNEKKELGLEFIQDMSDTYRYTLTSAKKDLVSLNEEVTFIHAYVFLFQKRMGEKFQFKLNIPAPFLKRKIPPMSLQLLVENAIQHNIISTSSPLTLNITLEDEMICVENNLQKRAHVESFGIGLNNLNNRWKLLMNKEIIINQDASKFLVKLPLS